MIKGPRPLRGFPGVFIGVLFGFGTWFGRSEGRPLKIKEQRKLTTGCLGGHPQRLGGMAEKGGVGEVVPVF